MNSYMKISLRSITVGLLLVSPLLAADDFRFVKATVENTTLADGTRLKVVPKPGNDPAELQAQREGIALWPPIDVDQSNPLGVELRRP